MSVVKACAAVGLSRSAWYREPIDRLERDREVIDALQELVWRRNPDGDSIYATTDLGWMGTSGITSESTGFTGSWA